MTFKTRKHFGHFFGIEIENLLGLLIMPVKVLTDRPGPKMTLFVFSFPFCTNLSTAVSQFSESNLGLGKREYRHASIVYKTRNKFQAKGDWGLNCSLFAKDCETQQGTSLNRVLSQTNLAVQNLCLFSTLFREPARTSHKVDVLSFDKSVFLIFLKLTKVIILVLKRKRTKCSIVKCIRIYVFQIQLFHFFDIRDNSHSSVFILI